MARFSKLGRMTRSGRCCRVRSRRSVSHLASVLLASTAAGCSLDPSATAPPSSNDDPLVAPSGGIEPWVSPDPVKPGGPTDARDQVTFSAEPVFCCNPLSREFSADVPDIGVLIRDIAWDFGDGASASGALVQHAFRSEGDYTVVLTVALDSGEFLEASQVVSVRKSGGSGGGMDPGEAPDEHPDLVDPQSFILSADAGPDRVASPGSTVELDAGASQTGDEPLVRFQWQQIAGTPVVLQTSNAPKCTFTAPAATGMPQILAFRLTLTYGSTTDADTVQVVVAALQNRPPVVDSGEFRTLVDKPVMIVLRGRDVEGAALTFRIIAGPRHGELGPINRLAADSAGVQYTPSKGFSGSDEVTFVASDGAVDSPTGTASIVVLPAGQPPQVTALSYLVPMSGRSRLRLVGRDEDGDDLTFRVVEPPPHAVLGSIDNAPRDAAFVDFTPEPGFRGRVSFTVTAGDGSSEASPAVIDVEVRKRFIPWLEFNSHPNTPVETLDLGPETGARPGWTLLDFCLAGVDHWSAVTDSVVITTGRTRVGMLYPWLRRTFPSSITLIGGLKSSDYVPGAVPYNPQIYDFADAEAWRAFARDARTMTAETGTNVFVIENETGILPYTRNEARIDFDKLRQSLLPLRDTGIETWWYMPQINEENPGFPDRQADSVRFVAAIAETLPNARFLTTFSSFSLWKRFPPQRRDIMIETVGGVHRLNELMYVTHDGIMGQRHYYDPSEAIMEMETLPAENTNVIYPGMRSWLRTAELFDALLPPLADSPD